MTRASTRWDREKPVGSRLPYLAQIDDHTVLLRDGRLLQTLRLDGLLFETADTTELNYRKALRDSMLQAIGTARFALYQHVLRRRVEPELAGDWPDPFSQRLDTAWARKLGSKRLFCNDIYVTLVRRPSPGALGGVARLAQWLGRAGGEMDIEAERRALVAARDALLATLAPYGARPLGTYERGGALHSEILEFLSALYNGERRPVQLAESDLGHYLPYRRVSFGADMIEIGASGTLPRQFLSMLSVKNYPSETFPGMLDDLLRLPFELTLTQSFAFVDRQAALGRVNLALRRMRASDDEAISLRSEMLHARDELAAGRSSFGLHHLSLAIKGDTPAEVDEASAEAQAAMIDLGLMVVREEVGIEPAFWAQFPGNFQFITRDGMVASRNFASLASCHNFPIGRENGNHWGPAVTILETTAAGPYFFNFHHGDLGNFTVIGPSGSGKTVVLNFLLAQARKIKPRIVFFDKDRGAELFLRAVGGHYHVLRPGEPAALNPLLLPDTKENRRFIIDWVAQLLFDPDKPLSAADQALISEAVTANMAAPPEFRRLSYFAQLFRGGDRPHQGDLFSRLAQWWGDGERAWLFDNDTDDTDLLCSAAGFDMTRILDDPVSRTPTMMYLFHRVEERLDGTPSIIVVDEGWKALDDEVFVARIRDWEKTIRKRNGIVGFATQSAEDALSSRIASAIVEQAATQIFMPNPKAQSRDYIEGFGLTAHEFDLVRTLPDNAHAFLIKHGQESVVARLDLTGEPELLTILSGREKTVRLLDKIRRENGDDPAVWLPRLLELV